MHILAKLFFTNISNRDCGKDASFSELCESPVSPVSILKRYRCYHLSDYHVQYWLNIKRTIARVSQRYCTQTFHSYSILKLECSMAAIQTRDACRS